MKVDGDLLFDPRTAGESAHACELEGYDGVWAGEMRHDPLVVATLATQHTQRIDIGTSVVVAFARNPMSTAVCANDLQLMSGGRFILGLGSQVEAHITKRFSMPWSSPAMRMREFVLALRSIWSSWQDGTTLAFRGDFYTHTLMTPFFNPGPNPHGPPPVYIAAVNRRMTEVAGEVGDGLLCHAFTTERFLREVTLPAVEAGRAKAGKPPHGSEIVCPTFVVTGRDDAELAVAAQQTKQQIAFYGSTPSYRHVLELHGWGDLSTDLHRYAGGGRWADMGNLIDDAVLDAFAVVGEPDAIAAGIESRFGDVLTRASLYTPYGIDRGLRSSIVADLKALAATRPPRRATATDAQLRSDR
jgi:probable F420-dependent oxidoreductase